MRKHKGFIFVSLVDGIATFDVVGRVIQVKADEYNNWLAAREGDTDNWGEWRDLDPSTDWNIFKVAALMEG